MSSSSDSSSFTVVDPHSDHPNDIATTMNNPPPNSMSNKVKVGAVQAEPAWLNLQGSVDKVISLIEQAGKDSVNVLGFPEVFVPGYPW